MKRIDLSKATFIIPIRIESDDRLRNVITSVCFLLSNFKTNIIIKEVDKTSVFSEKAYPQIKEFCDTVEDLTHVFEQSDDPAFHRQKVLNDMVMMSETECVVNYDCDIILPIASITQAYDRIMNKTSDVVYPYGNGDFQLQVFANDEVVTDFLVNDFRFKALSDVSKPYDAKYGFVQFFNRDVYIEGGLENENFVAYAPEDVERYYRYTTLGYKVSRINDLIYHLEHSRTPNSWLNNPYMHSNNIEWEKIQKMDKETLREYITSQDYYVKRINGQK